MPAALAADPRWQYWRARCAQKLGRKDEAEGLYGTLAQDNGYYRVLAAWRLDRRYEPRTRQLDADRTAQQRLVGLNAALLRTRRIFHGAEVHAVHRERRTQN